jgi:hypothetical protein
VTAFQIGHLQCNTPLSSSGKVMKHITFAMLLGMVAAFSCLAPLPAEAQVVGRFSVEGQNPNGSRYAGSASVERTGETYRVVWTIDGTRFVGTGIGNDQAIAITYRAGNETGVALLGEGSNGYGLVWTYAGGRDLGTERWTRR